MAILFGLFQFQFQFFTLKLQNSDRQKVGGLNVIMETLVCKRNVFFSESLLHEPPSSDLSILGRVPRTGGSRTVFKVIFLKNLHFVLTVMARVVGTIPLMPLHRLLKTGSRLPDI